ncbi:Hypothetical protein A7982_04374 [Minicystis rosea]|nr:Hypothetical protein A7982_04374 [Minicystis rosea]
MISSRWSHIEASCPVRGSRAQKALPGWYADPAQRRYQGGEHARSRAVVFGGLVDFVALMAGWIAFTASRGI